MAARLENRLRLLRELIEDTKEAVGERLRRGARIAVDELHGRGRLRPCRSAKR